MKQEKVQKPKLKNTAHVPPPEEEESIFMEIPKPKAKKTINVEIQDLNSPKPTSYQPKLPYPERMKVRENDKPSAQHIRFLKMFKQLRLEIGLKDALVEMPKFNKWLSSLLRNKEKLEEIAITTVNAECSAIIMNKVPEKLEDPGKFYLSHCAFNKEPIANNPFSGSTTTYSDDPSPSSSPVKTSDNFEKFADKLAPLDSLPLGNDDSTLKKDLHEENFQVHSNPLFEFDDIFKSSTINPLFDEMEKDVEIKNSNVFDEPVLLNTPLSDKVAQEDNNDEIDAFLAMEVSSNFEEGYFDSEGDVTFLDNLLSDDASHNLASEVISDHEPEQNESSITFSPRSDPLHHEFAGELLTLPSRNNREFGEYLSLMTVLCEISTSQSQENVHANQSSVIESLPVSPIPVEDSEPAQEEIDIFLVPDDLIPPGVENDDSEDEDNELPNLDHQDDPSIPCPQFHRKTTRMLRNVLNPKRVRIYQKSQENSQKIGKHEHGNRKSTKEAKDSKAKPRKVNSPGQLTSNTKCHITDCHTGNPCEIESHPTAQDDSQMIDGMIGQDSKERVQQGTA
ncbi:hypothetical protein Tco_1384082 [Tanacetum coccineum]